MALKQSGLPEADQRACHLRLQQHRRLEAHDGLVQTAKTQHRVALATPSQSRSRLHRYKPFAKRQRDFKAPHLAVDKTQRIHREHGGARYLLSAVLEELGVGYRENREPAKQWVRAYRIP